MSIIFCKISAIPRKKFPPFSEMQTSSTSFRQISFPRVPVHIRPAIYKPEPLARAVFGRTVQPCAAVLFAGAAMNRRYKPERRKFVPCAPELLFL